MDWWKSKSEAIDSLINFCNKTTIKPKDINGFLNNIGSAEIKGGVKISELIARPQITLENISKQIPELKAMIEGMGNRQEEIKEAAEIKMKYKGYIKRERIFAEKMHRLENINIKGHFKYSEILDLSTECRQKLERIQPETIAQASRIPGVSPSDINVLLVLMNR